MAAKAGVSEHDLADCLRDVFGKIFFWSGPRGGLGDGEADGVDDGFGFGSGEDVAAAFNGFGTLGHVAKRYIWNAEDRTLFLDRATVCEDGE